MMPVLARRQAAPLLAAMGAVVSIAACGDDDGLTRLPDQTRAALVTMSLDAVELTELGATVHLVAQVFDQNGRAMAVAPTWSSSDTAVAVVDGSGLVTAIGNGVATISAAVDGAAGTTEVTVADGAVIAAAMDRAALVRLYQATDGPNWTNADNWLTDAEIGTWHGVGADAEERVVRLHLDRNGLRGTLPADLGDLGKLQRLDLAGNELSGAFPRSLVNLGLLHTLIVSPRHVAGNADLCAPGTTEFVTWLRGVAYFDGHYCGEPDAAVLEHLYGTAGGPDWTNSGGWLETPVLGEWYGVTADSTGRVLTLDLSGNGLSGQLRGDWAGLANLTRLRLADNRLYGRIPPSLARLPLVELNYSATELCTPAAASFREWLGSIASHAGTGLECPPPPDLEVLAAVHEATDGANWLKSDNWLTEAPLEDWHGVHTDADGRVVHLDLGNNALSGAIPPQLGDLAALTRLVLWGNGLTGTIPPELGKLANLEALHLEANSLTGPIPPEIGSPPALESLGLSANYLSGPIPRELGNLERLVTLDLWGNELTGAIPPELGKLANLEALHLEANSLTGPIPPEIGSPPVLESLGLSANYLSGPIPRELGNLERLVTLDLWGNELTGAIPPELGSLSNLMSLHLSDNGLTGPIPEEVANIRALVSLNLADNHLSGGIPSRFARLSALASLLLGGNELTGPVPSELGSMSSLLELSLSDNVGMSGPLPLELTDLGLEALLADGTGLCAPAETRFQRWLRRVHKRRIRSCEGGGPSMAYLTQAVQSRDYPVPLVADEGALLRVFATAATPTRATMPPVRARFFLDGDERHAVHVAAAATPLPTEVLEGNLGGSANASVPGEIVQPGLEMVIEIDPDGTLDPGVGVANRIPETGRMAIDVQRMPVLALTVIPFLWSGGPDSAIVEAAGEMAADPDTHDLLWETRTLLPVGDLDVTAHAPVLTSTNDIAALIEETEAIRALEGGSGHYMGVMSGQVAGRVRGIAAVPGRVSASIMDPVVMAHELGHNLSLDHAPCGGAANPDQSFPYAGGSTGAWGYDPREGGRLIEPDEYKDIMSYCEPEWISDYFFTNALRFRLVDEGRTHPAAVLTPRQQSLLLWGGMDADGELFLNPTFVVEARPVLPDSAGGHRITGETADGRELFRLEFAMPELADGAGRSSFAFVLPAQPSWADSLTSVTLSGSGGSVTLDTGTDAPMAIWFDPASGQVRGFIRDPAWPDAPAALAPPQPDLDLFFSRGIPDAAAWSP